MLIKCDLHRVFSNHKLYISYVISLAILLRPLVEALTEGGGQYSFLYLQSIPFGLSDYTPFAAIFCVLPFADSFCEDYNSGYIHSILLRIGTKKYAFQRFLMTAFSGGVLMSLTVLTVLLFCYIAAEIPDTAETVVFMQNTLLYKKGLLLRWNGIFFIAYRVLFAFLFGCLWASVGFCISTIVVNRYVTFVAPFVLYQILWTLIENASFNPAYALRGDYASSSLCLISYQLIQIIVCGIYSIYRIQRRMIQ